ncbi:MAG: hypothetical protein CMG61_06845 [Candidatus Marinimicrobia bacterium]|nr:hypothetical protein [Candidatus Neomarinimicrobiota bacterium]
MLKFVQSFLFILVFNFLLSEKLPNDIRWVVKSDEYEMICIQTYDLAKSRLKEIYLESDDISGKAIIMDLDETILNNSQYQVEISRKGETFNMKSWAKWVNRSEASLVPGAKEFIDLARDIGIQLIFISNRMDKRLDSTKKNMKSLNIFSDDDIYLLRLDRKDKKTIRRNEVFKGENRMSEYGPFDVVMYFGDAMGDFEEKDFYNNFIFPNPMYGKW